MRKWAYNYFLDINFFIYLLYNKIFRLYVVGMELWNALNDNMYDTYKKNNY